MKHNKFKFLGLTILLVSLLVLVGCNQELGTLTVEVMDEAEEDLNATVEVSREDQTKEKESSDGIAQFKELPTGEYQVKVSKDGYKTVTDSVTLEEKNLSYEVDLEEKTYDLKINISDQDGKELSATAKLEGADATHTKSIEDGNTTIEDLKPGDYQLAVTKDGYQTAEKEITVKQDDLTTDLELEEEEEKEVEKFNLTLNVLDNNENELPADIKIKKDDSVVEEATESELDLEDLKSDKYTIEVSKSNYETWTKEIDLDEDTTLNATLKGGSVNQKIVDAEDGKQTIEIDDLKDDEEAIVGVSYMDWDNIDEDKIYPVRRKANQLIEDHGTDFVDNERDYQVGDEKEFKVPDKVNDEGKLNAELVKTGENIYVFAAENAAVSDEKIDQLVKEFDNDIAPTLTNKSNVNGKVTVLLTKFSNYQMTGYFDPADLYPELGNEEPMFYLNANRSSNTQLTSAAHQYQHFNFFLDKAKADRIANDEWIDQGIAQIAPQLLGYIDPSKEGWSEEKGYDWVYNQDLGYFNKTSEVNLLTHDGSLPFTGAAGLFANYLLDNHGEELIHEIVTSSEDPRTVIADYTGQSFNKVYLNWVTANVTDNIAAVTNPVYNYSSFDLNQMPNLDNEDTSTYGVNYFKVDDNEFTIEAPEDFEGKIGVVVIKQKAE